MRCKYLDVERIRSETQKDIVPISLANDTSRQEVFEQKHQAISARYRHYEVLHVMLRFSDVLPSQQTSLMLFPYRLPFVPMSKYQLKVFLHDRMLREHS